MVEPTILQALPVYRCVIKSQHLILVVLIRNITFTTVMVQVIIIIGNRNLNERLLAEPEQSDTVKIITTVSFNRIILKVGVSLVTVISEENISRHKKILIKSHIPHYLFSFHCISIVKELGHWSGPAWQVVRYFPSCHDYNNTI